MSAEHRFCTKSWKLPDWKKKGFLVNETAANNNNNNSEIFSCSFLSLIVF